MRHDVIVRFDAQQVVEIPVDGQHLPDPAAARAWLDEEFMRLQCEPLRPSGKLLTADKLLVLARDAGPSALADPAWGPGFARAVLGLLQSKAVTINLVTMKVGY